MQCNFCSVTRHTAREHPTEAKVHYPFHPQFGESVIIRRRLVTNNAAMAVILQPDGSLGFLPAWMLDESAARFTIHQSPTFSVPFLQSLRAEIDALLASLPSDSKPGGDGNASKNRDARKHSAGLFEQEQPEVEMPPTGKRQLAALIEVLMIEIAAALAIREDDDDQDHR